MYRPDPSIVKQLQECDPDLDVRWDRHDERWWVTCLGKDVQKVVNPDGSFRPLDNRVVESFREQAWNYRQRFGVFHMHDKQTWERRHEAARKRKEAERDNFRQYAIEEIHPRVVGVGGINGRSKFTGWSASA